MNRNNDVNVNRNNNVNVNRNNNVNVNRNRDIDVDVDVHHRGGYYGGCCYDDHHPRGRCRGCRGGGRGPRPRSSVQWSTHLPPSCSVVIQKRSAYQQCGNTWYQPQFVGTTTSVRRRHLSALTGPAWSGRHRGDPDSRPGGPRLDSAQGKKEGAIDAELMAG